MINVFGFTDYISFLLSVLGPTGSRSGRRSQLAEAIGCQTAYLSKVLKGQTDLSLEQAVGAAEFLLLSETESEYFLMLVQRARAGSAKLKSYFDKKIQALMKDRGDLKKRLAVDPRLSMEDQGIYYSAWYYAAIHILVALKTLNDKEGLSEFLDLPRALVSEVVDFLLLKGLIELKGEKLVPGPTHIHVGKESPQSMHHHRNWRSRSLIAMERKAPENFHYTVVVSCSKKTVRDIRERIISMIQENVKDIEASSEEVVFCNIIDFFEVTRS